VTPPDKLKSLYIDFDAFFANVEKQLNPDLWHRPVGISPFPSEHSSLIAQCYVAKAFGLHRGMKVRDARSICPDLCVVTARHDVYVEVHHKIIAAIEKHIPVKKVWSVDEMECDFGNLNDEDCLQITRNVRRQLAEDIGPYITPSIGLSSCNLLAKIAAEMNKPNGFEVFHPRDLPGRLLGVPLRDVPGIAHGLEIRLNRAGIQTMEDFWNTSAKQARAIWRSVEGERIWWMLHGYPIDKMPTKRAMFGHSRQLSGEWSSPKRAEDCLRLLTSQAARRMRKDGFMATKLSLSFRDQNKTRYSREINFAPARDDYTFLRHMRTAFSACLQEAEKDRFVRASPHRLTVRQVFVTLHGLTCEGAFSESLFSNSDDKRKQKNLSRLSDAIDATNLKYQSNILTVGPQEQPPGDYAGGKIAFGRIPDAMAYAKRVQAKGEEKRRAKVRYSLQKV
jgi:DNA polymerase-4